MRKKFFTKVILITMALLLVLSVGCSKSGKSTSAKSKASVKNAQMVKDSQQIQSTTKAKATINKDLDQLDKDLDQLDKADSGVNNLKENDF